MTVEQITAGCGCWSCRAWVPDAVEALAFVRDEVARMERSVRQAEPLPPHGVSAGLDLIGAAARNALGEKVVA